jgi:hypothetical protein
MPSDDTRREAGHPPDRSVKFWNDPAKRAVVFQVLLVGTIILFAADMQTTP